MYDKLFLAIKQVDKEEQIKDMKINLQKMELEIMQLQNNLKEAENILVGSIECICIIYFRKI